MTNYGHIWSTCANFRLARYFGTSPELWLGLQQDYELDVARDNAAAQIKREVLPRAG